MDIEEIKRTVCQLKRISFETSIDYLKDTLEEINEEEEFQKKMEIKLELGKLYLSDKKHKKCFEIVNEVLEKCRESKNILLLI